MAINIPSNLPIPPIQDFHQQELIRPTEAPSVVEGVIAVDPRVALNIAMPVAPSSDGSSMSDSVRSGLQNNAVILEIAKGEVANLKGGGQNLAESIAKLDSLGSLALGQLLSELFSADQANQAGMSSSKLGNAQTTVAWPNLKNSQTPIAVDLSIAMSTLYKDLESSGIFAASQLKALLMPASNTEEDQHVFHETLARDVNTLLSQLTGDGANVRDAVKLLLRGELVWQGQLLPNVMASIYRQDAWDKDSHNQNEVIKGSRFTLSVDLPNLGPLEIIGTQFGEQVSLSIKTGDEAKELLVAKFSDLLDQITQKNGDSVSVSFARDGEGMHGS